MSNCPVIKLDKESIHALFNNGSPNARQRNTLKLKFGLSMRSGWLDRLKGREISVELYNELLCCKGRRPKGWPRNDWRKAIEV